MTMQELSIQAVSDCLSSAGLKHQLRDDRRIVLTTGTSKFKDIDDDQSLFVIISLPYPNYLRVSAVSLLSIDNVKDIAGLLELLNGYNNGPIGCFSVNEESRSVYWRSDIYTEGSMEQVSLHIFGALANIISFLDDHVSALMQGLSTQEGGDSHMSEDLLVQRLEQCLQIESTDPTEQLPPTENYQLEPKLDDVNSEIELIVSGNLSDSARQYVADHLESVHAYLRKNQLELPKGTSLRIQHGNDMKNVEEGPNKGPYLVVVGADGKEKRSAKVFLSKRGNLNHYVSVSTILSRA
jgi:hypothetical protein